MVIKTRSGMKQGVKKAKSTLKCRQCSHTAKTLGELKYHIVYSHSKTRRQINEVKRHTRHSLSQDTQKNIVKKTAPKSGIKPKCTYKCTECDYKCFQKRNLDSHVKEVHQKIEKSANGSNGTPMKCVVSDMFSINKLVCSGCDQEFNKDYELYVHMEFVHREQLVCLFMSSEDEFDKWRSEVEKVIKVKYALIKITAKKQIYKCAVRIDSKSDDTYIQCPSMIIAKVINDGLQVVFHKQHFGHPAIDYTPPEQIKKMTINLNGERDAMQFTLRKILRDTYRESCALSTDCAKKLIDKATQLKEYASKLATEFGTKDVQGTKLLGKRKLGLNFKNIDKKIRSLCDEVVVKEEEEEENNEIHKPKLDIKCKPIENLISTRQTEVVPKILNIFTLTDVNDDGSKSDTEIKPEIATDTPNDTNKVENKDTGLQPEDVIPEIKKARSKYEELLSNSTFNETYESFVKSNFQTKVEDTKKTALTPKNPTSFYNAKKKSYPKPASVKNISENESNDQNNDLLVPKKKKKKIAMKTKLGQFSPKKSPIIEDPPPSLDLSQSVSWELPVTTTKFQEYEVQEREDDCNILILKF